MSNVLSTYAVQRDGTTVGPALHASSGQTPFGFAFTRHGVAVVSEAFGGAMAAGAVSSYEISSHGSISKADRISVSVPNFQAAPCWVVIREDRFAYVTNTGSHSVSSYRVRGDGSLDRIDAIAAYLGEGTGPIDMALGADESFLYVLGGASDDVNVLRVENDGDLTPVQEVSGLPPHAAGLAGR
jgi:hypothetical protein